MVDFKSEIAKLIAEQVSDLEVSEIREIIEVPQDSKMGTMRSLASNLLKHSAKRPPLIAKGIAEKIAENGMFEKVEQVNAYVNMFISKEELVKDVVEDVLEKMVLTTARPT